MKPGKIIVITGPMKSGKSEEILRRSKRYRIAGKSVLMVKPDNDTRFSEGEIVSRNKNSQDCVTIPRFNPEYILGIVDQESQVVIIDEAQFFKKRTENSIDIVGVVKILSDKGHTVICSGLDMDSDGIPFGDMPYLMAISDEVIKLKSVCEICGDDNANLTASKVKKESQILVGDKEYYAICRNCLKNNEES